MDYSSQQTRRHRRSSDPYGSIVGAALLGAFLALLLLMSLLQGCATLVTDPAKEAAKQSESLVLKMGQELDQVGRDFITVGKLYDQAYQSKSITPEKYKIWSRAVPGFQKTHKDAYIFWKNLSRPGITPTQIYSESPSVQSKINWMKEELTRLRTAYQQS